MYSGVVVLAANEGRIYLGCEPDDDLNWVAGKIGQNGLLAASDMPHTDEASHDDVVSEFAKRGDLAPESEVRAHCASRAAAST